jgi:hypothetical protein
MLKEQIRRLKMLLGGEPSQITPWLEEKTALWPLVCLGIIASGGGVYGFTLGWWRGYDQSFYTAVKFPLLIFLTCLGNAGLNGMLAQALGSKMTFRQTGISILMSFVLAALILGAVSPAMLFLVWNAPPLEQGRTTLGHSVVLLSHVAAVAFAGVVANQRLLRLLRHFNDSPALARRILFAWLAGNLLLGSQLAWILRPFIGSPGLPVQFLRNDPLRGNFFEAVFYALKRLFSA